MWQVLSQEKPARPRLALIVASLALGCTLGMAWSVCSRRAVIRVDGEQRPANWPIRFRLPDYVLWTQHGIDSPLRDSEDGAIGAIDFLGIELGHRAYGLRVKYWAISPKAETDENEVVTVLRGSESGDSEPIDVGPLKGRLRVRQIGYSAELLASASTPDGLSIEVELSATPFDPYALEIMRDICDSIEYQDWRMPRPELLPASEPGVSNEVSS